MDSSTLNIKMTLNDRLIITTPILWLGFQLKKHVLDNSFATSFNFIKRINVQATMQMDFFGEGLQEISSIRVFYACLVGLVVGAGEIPHCVLPLVLTK